MQPSIFTKLLNQRFVKKSGYVLVPESREGRLYVIIGIPLPLQFRTVYVIGQFQRLTVQILVLDSGEELVP
ncbi:hypothetical protein [Paenibacillus sp. Marseille-Q4541]|uniref:hypothetical protein n=1 Tax=Paenibacillus sp. Marseille-Q4541 TaxID=2831522 RepID=UPI001BAAF1D0|nr:hypothetical protein [Paenibacillus sp. Marseille-Q4541]